MDDRPEALCLSHIVAAIAAARSFTAEGRDAFMADLKTLPAVVLRADPEGRSLAALPSQSTAQPC